MLNDFTRPEFKGVKVRMTEQPERRDRGRFPGQILFIRIGLIAAPIIDISAGGVAFEAEGYSVGDTITLKIISVLDATDFAEAECSIVKVDGFRVAAQFANPSERLLSYIGTYLKQWA